MVAEAFCGDESEGGYKLIDISSVTKRSDVVSRFRGKDTQPELIARHLSSHAS